MYFHVSLYTVSVLLVPRLSVCLSFSHPLYDVPDRHSAHLYSWTEEKFYHVFSVFYLYFNLPLSPMSFIHLLPVPILLDLLVELQHIRHPMARGIKIRHLIPIGGKCYF